MGFTEATFAYLLRLLVIVGVSIVLTWVYHGIRKRMHDPVDGEPLLAEEALVHAKSDFAGRYQQFYTIHFYIAARDTVVDCEVPYEIWRDLEMKSRGTLTHQGGMFYSFETKDAMYCEESLYAPDAHY